MELNVISINILKLLYESDEFLTIKEIMVKIDSTQRVVRYNMSKLESFLESKKLWILKYDFKKGYKIIKNKEAMDFYSQFLDSSDNFYYKFTREERKNYILTYLLRRSNYVSMGKLADQLMVSVSTINSDLIGVDEFLEKRGCVLIRKARLGLFVNADEMKKMQLYNEIAENIITSSDVIHYLNDKPIGSKINKILLDDIFDKIDKTFLKNTIEEIEERLSKKFTDESFSSLLIHVAMMVYRVINGFPIGENEISEDSILNNTIEYTVSEQLADNIGEVLKIAIPKYEVLYFTIHLLSAKVINISINEDNQSEESKEIERIAELMVDEMSNLYALDFKEKRNETIAGLISHLVPTVYRIKYNKNIVNPIYNEIISKYSELFANTKIICRHLSDYCKEPISDHEISYITMHFMATICSIESAETNVPKIILICGSGYGTAQVVATQIMTLFNAEIVAVISERDAYKIYDTSKHTYDYLISTVSLRDIDANEYIKVSPMFSHEDFMKINEYLSAKMVKNDIGYRKLELSERLADIACKYGSNIDKLQLQYEFLLEINKKNNLANYTKLQNNVPLNLEDILLPSLIRLNAKAKSWTEAIIEGCKNLEDGKYITENYKYEIIEHIKEHGPNMVIIPGIVLAHTIPDNSCRKIGFSITTLERPVRFGHKKNDPVSMVITLSVIDEDTHKEALLQLFNLLNSQLDREKLLRATNKNEIVDLVKKYSNYEIEY